MKGEECRVRVADGIGNDEVGIPKGNENLKNDYPNPEYSGFKNFTYTVSIGNLNCLEIWCMSMKGMLIYGIAYGL
jgi:hypothetical protein